ncbi:hypothetical protein J4218_01945 [Candidatus Pacearchaeota archaeon]|nr:hypothetical protein [uncultured archaeon]MBS3078859.1 hypothetical protein [Candidatus Pacearchaeota archaeon]
MVSIKNIVFGIAIFILTISVGVYGISTFLDKSPQYDKVCPPRQILNEEQCVIENGTWTNYSYIPESKPILANERGYCDTYTICQPKFDELNRIHSRKIFFFALPLGIVIIIIGALLFGLESVGSGLMAGGVGIILYGIGSVWPYADDLIKFILSLIGLIIVIGVSYYANNKWKIFKKRK